MKKISILLLICASLTSCVSKKKFTELQNQYSSSKTHGEDMQKALDETKVRLNNCNSENEALKNQLALAEENGKNLAGNLADEKKKVTSLNENITLLKDNIETLKKNNNNLFDRLADLSVVSKTGAENIKKSLDAINSQGKYIQSLNGSMQRKDSLNLALVMNLKRSLADVNDKDVTVEVKKGVVYISISDKMLFQSGEFAIGAEAEAVLGKIAKVLNDHTELDILVEGHTDNEPISKPTPYISDNWDLSVKRATSVVRLLQTRFGVSPARMTAGGRGEFTPKTTNDTPDNKKLNRRTEIILLPKLDQFFQLMEPEKK